MINCTGQGMDVIPEERRKDSQQKLTALFTVFSKHNEINLLLKIKWRLHCKKNCTVFEMDYSYR